eukprot:Skav219321  [mRNA]  locus=scaffold1957:233980:234451:- [translate_table: standard]
MKRDSAGANVSEHKDSVNQFFEKSLGRSPPGADPPDLGRRPLEETGCWIQQLPQLPAGDDASLGVVGHRWSPQLGGATKEQH